MEYLFLLILIILASLLDKKARRFWGQLGFLSTNTGKAGERRVAKSLRRSFRRTHYHLFNDILLEYKGEITQVDHIVISSKGVFVIETKDLKGWVFGSPTNRNWTQIIYGDKYKFMNPIKQNAKHVRFVELLLDVESEFIQSLVVFTDRCTFKTWMPDHVMQRSKLKKYIRNYDFGGVLLKEDYVDDLAEKLSQIRLKNNRKNRKRHRKAVRAAVKAGKKV